LIKLSTVGIDNIFERFYKVIMANDSIKISNEVMKIRKAILHRPVNNTSPEYVKFLLHNLEEINKLTINFPYLNFENEIKYLKDHLVDIQESRNN